MDVLSPTWGLVYDFGVCLNSQGKHSCTYNPFPYFLSIHRALFYLPRTYRKMSMMINMSNITRNFFFFFLIYGFDKGGGDEEIAYKKSAIVVMTATQEIEGPVNNGRKLTKDKKDFIENYRYESRKFLSSEIIIPKLQISRSQHSFDLEFNIIMRQN